MARKSRWAQFADSFNSVYDAVGGALEDIETGKAMRAEYTGDDGQVLTGAALDRARTNALADIKARYGDTTGALSLRTNQAALDNALFQNEFNRDTRDARIRAIDDQAANAANSGLLQQSRIAANDALAQQRLADAAASDAARARNGNLNAIITNWANGLPGGSSGDTTPTPDEPSGGSSGGSSGDTNLGLARNRGRGDAAQLEFPENFGLSINPNEDPATFRNLTQPQPEPSTGGLDVPVAAPTDEPNDAPGDVFIPLGERPQPGAPRQPEVADLVRRLNGAGFFEEAKEIVDNYTDPEVLRISQEAVRMSARAQEAFARSGPEGVVALYDEYNGPMAAQLVTAPDGSLQLVEFQNGPDGPMNPRVVVSGRDQQQLYASFQGLFNNPAAAFDLSKGYWDYQTAQAQALAAEQDLTDTDTGTERTRITRFVVDNALSDDPNKRQEAYLFATTYLGMSADDFQDFTTRLGVERAATGDTNSETPNPETPNPEDQEVFPPGTPLETSEVAEGDGGEGNLDGGPIAQLEASQDYLDSSSAVRPGDRTAERRAAAAEQRVRELTDPQELRDQIMRLDEQIARLQVPPSGPTRGEALEVRQRRLEAFAANRREFEELLRRATEGSSFNFGLRGNPSAVMPPPGSGLAPRPPVAVPTPGYTVNNAFRAPNSLLQRTSTYNQMNAMNARRGN